MFEYIRSVRTYRRLSREIALNTKHRMQGVRTAKGLTQKQLGRSAGVSVSTISNIECHRGKDVPRSERRKTLTRLSTALKLSAALGQRGPGIYSVEEFADSQSLFTAAEIWEAIVNEQKRRDAVLRKRR